MSFDSAAVKYTVGEPIEKGLVKTEMDNSVNEMVRYYMDSVIWQQRFNVSAADSLLVKGSANFFYKREENIYRMNNHL